MLKEPKAMITTRQEYQFVAGDIDQVEIDGGIMPLRGVLKLGVIAMLFLFSDGFTGALSSLAR